ncbi:MAG: hypothetical protein ACSHW0_04535 [Thalassotalea sp.]
MEIQSAFQVGVQGFNQAQENANEAASAIASATAYDVQSQAEQSSSASTTTDVLATKPPQPADLTQEVVNLKVAEYQAKASAEVIQTADETLGTLLDVSV